MTRPSAFASPHATDAPFGASCVLARLPADPRGTAPHTLGSRQIAAPSNASCLLIPIFIWYSIPRCSITDYSPTYNSTEPGVYRFKTDLMMQGRWQLSLGAKVQGEEGAVETKLVLKALP
jgi:hypothetical protein